MRTPAFSTLILMFLAMHPIAPAKAFSEMFPQTGLEDRISFWKLVFTRYGERDVLFHDADDLRLIYHIEHFTRDRDNDPSEIRRQRNLLKRRHREIKALFDELIKFGTESSRLNSRHQKILKHLSKANYRLTTRTLSELKNRIRYQRGIKEKFKEGLVRSGRYLDLMKAIFQSYDLPPEIAFLPHIESSFDYNAYSRAGAAGIWQFTRGTGRNYLRINRYLDERLDPIRATDAAARLMKDNFAALGNWPLTITSYNHGKNGMLRAKKQFGSDLTTIIKKYRSRYFGFASKNFYAEFLAAASIAMDSERYFGELELQSPLQFETVQLQNSYDSSHFTSVPGLSRTILTSYNPHLKRVLSSAGNIVPAGVYLRVPVGKSESVKIVLRSARPSKSGIMIASDGSTRYRVRRGDVLSTIASEFGTSVRSLKRLNGIRNANRIHVGQVLLITSSSQKARVRETAQKTPSTHRVRSGDTLSSIAKRFDSTVQALTKANSIQDPNQLKVGTVLNLSVASRNSTKKYRVRRGDTLAKIAGRFGTSINSIKNANRIRNPNLIQPGQELIIP
jgi:membrane-bound lytic murein transglycosylase D